MSKSSIKKLAKKLKESGLYSGDLRLAFTKGRSDYITKLAKKHNAILTRPKDYVSRTVSKSLAKKIQIDADRVNIGGKVRLFFKAEKVSITSKHVKTWDSTKIANRVEIVTTPHISGADLANNLEAELKKAFKNLPKGASLTFRIGENAPFRKSYKNIEQALPYIKGWTPKDPESDRDALISQMQIVEIARSVKTDKAGKK